MERRLLRGKFKGEEFEEGVEMKKVPIQTILMA